MAYAFVFGGQNNTHLQFHHTITSTYSLVLHCHKPVSSQSSAYGGSQRQELIAYKQHQQVKGRDLHASMHPSCSAEVVIRPPSPSLS